MKRFIFIIFLLTTWALIFPHQSLATCDYPSLCNTTQRTGSDPKPNDNCVIPGVTTDAVGTTTYPYHFGTTNSCGFFGGGGGSCVPRCGALGMGFCCDPDNKSKVPPDASVPVPPPCANDIKAAGKCTTINTPLGQIQTDIPGLTKSLFSILLGFSGGVAILLIIAAGYQLMMSQGNPEKVKDARERLIAAIVGLIFIFFSVTILQIIGVDILQIPGFGR